MTGKGFVSGCVLVAVVAFSGTSVAQPVRPGGGVEAATPPRADEIVRRGVVVIERDGLPAAFGTVLDGDGRILTALSGLNGANEVDLRYGDGSTARAALVRKDAARDLALVSPEGAGRTEGLRASDVDTTLAGIAASLPTPSALLAPAQTLGLRDLRSTIGKDVRLLGVKVTTALPVAGAPLLDATGRVLAVLVRACEPAANPPAARPWASSLPAAPVCRPVLAGVPVAQLRSFLAPAAPPPAMPAPPPASTGAAHPWLGIRGDTRSFDGIQGVRLLAVAPNGPAALAGLTPKSDVVVAVDGQKVGTPDELAREIAKRSPGDRLRLLVFRAGEFRDVTVALQAAPKG